MEISSYRDLKVWQEAMSIAERAYRLTARLPKEEVYGMTSQIRRAATSVAANIAEGHGRESGGSFIQFLRMAQGSLKELETHLLLALRVDLVASDEAKPVLAQCDELGRMLRSLIRSIQRRQDHD
ncbi:four helix bundle protein [Bradyrhizobium sp.]|uniref:four helix bundle protein n=1 Tax=Bradyrhizobium sp. TaxID=376 RepID=UPI00261408C0|nr:four helix bundle protein [Bradyrhizobium sp.]